jgi:hypothetical protein
LISTYKIDIPTAKYRRVVKKADSLLPGVRA